MKKYTLVMAIIAINQDTDGTSFSRSAVTRLSLGELLVDLLQVSQAD